MVSAIPITAILTAHQRRMAEIIHQGGGNNAEVIARLAAELAELRNLVHQQSIALDDMSNLQRRMLSRTTEDSEVRQRLGQ